MTQKHTFARLTDRFDISTMTRRRLRLRLADDDQCWICLDGDTEGREVRARSIFSISISTTTTRDRDRPSSRRRRRPAHRRLHPHPSPERKRANARRAYIPYDGSLIGKSRAVYGTKKVAFSKKYLSRGVLDLIVLYMGVRVCTHMGDSMGSLCEICLFFDFLCAFFRAGRRETRRDEARRGETDENGIDC